MSTDYISRMLAPSPEPSEEPRPDSPAESLLEAFLGDSARRRFRKARKDSDDDEKERIELEWRPKRRRPVVVVEEEEAEEEEDAAAPPAAAAAVVEEKEVRATPDPETKPRGRRTRGKKKAKTEERAAETTATEETDRRHKKIAPVTISKTNINSVAPSIVRDPEEIQKVLASADKSAVKASGSSSSSGAGGAKEE